MIPDRLGEFLFVWDELGVISTPSVTQNVAV